MPLHAVTEVAQGRYGVVLSARSDDGSASPFPRIAALASFSFCDGEGLRHAGEALGLDVEGIARRDAVLACDAG